MREKTPEHNLEILLNDEQFRFTFFFLLATYLAEQKVPHFKEERWNISEQYGGGIALNQNPKHLRIMRIADSFITRILDQCKTVGDFKAFCARPGINVQFPDDQQFQQIVNEALEKIPRRQD